MPIEKDAVASGEDLAARRRELYELARSLPAGRTHYPCGYIWWRRLAFWRAEPVEGQVYTYGHRLRKALAARR